MKKFFLETYVCLSFFVFFHIITVPPFLICWLIYDAMMTENNGFYPMFGWAASFMALWGTYGVWQSPKGKQMVQTIREHGRLPKS